VSTADSARSRLLGDAPRLPLRIALHVARTSIRVRLSRSLVTVSSVVLAVAFLLTVIGENVVLQSVFSAWHRDSTSIRQALALREALERPRTSLALIRLSVTHSEMLSSWTQSTIGRSLPITAAVAATANELANWIAELPPSKSYLILGNRSVEEWLLALRSETQVDALLATTRELKGVRLDMARDRLVALAAGMPALAEALQAAGEAETKRLTLVSDAGGPEAVLMHFHDGADLAALTAVGLPIDQILPELYDPAAGSAATAARALLTKQIALDRARTKSAELIARLNGVDVNLISDNDVHWDVLQAAIASSSEKASSPVHQIAKVNELTVADFAALCADPAQRAAAITSINRAISSAALWKKDAWAGLTLDRDTDALSKRVRLSDRQQTRLGRLLLEQGLPGAINAAPPITPLELRSLLEGGLDSDPRGPALRTQLTTIAGGVTLPELSGELARRARLGDIDHTFAALGYDPIKAGAKTFWLVVLSLLVCTVGIVNTMMMAVTERFREIATMKCLGATDGFVLKAFLLESSMVGSAGAMLGAVIGFLLVLIQGSVRFGGPFWSAFPVAGLASAAGISLACGLVLAVSGALLPALKASRMHPIEAMRIDA